MRLIFANSATRDTSLYPSGNSYTLYLSSPVRNVDRVDLVSARVPNTMYNLSNGSSCFTTSGTTYSLPAGFYGVWDLATQISLAAQPALTCSYIQYQGKFQFSGGPLTVNSSQLAQMLGVPVGVPITGQSNAVVNMSLGEYVYLDIDELKTPNHVYTGALATIRSSNVYWQTVSGANTQRAFAPVPLDVISGTIKNFHENKDFKVSVRYPEPIGSLDRLTIKWLDVYGNPLIFNGLETNSFLLRIHTKDSSKEDAFILDALPPPVPLDGGPNLALVGALMLAGLLVILFVRKT
jgi:hypothetical protein